MYVDESFTTDVTTLRKYVNVYLKRTLYGDTKRNLFLEECTFRYRMSRNRGDDRTTDCRGWFIIYESFANAPIRVVKSRVLCDPLPTLSLCALITASFSTLEHCVSNTRTRHTFWRQTTLSLNQGSQVRPS